MPASNSKPKFISNQGLSWLAGDGAAVLRFALTRETQRAAHLQPRETADEDKPLELQVDWIPIDRAQLARVICRGLPAFQRPTRHKPPQPPDDSPVQPTQRVCVVVDAGMGKTILLKWGLRRELERRNCLAVYVDIGNLRTADIDSPIDWLLGIIRSDVQQAPNLGLLPQVSAARLEREITGFLRRGQVCLLFDGLDQVAENSEAMRGLRKLLANSDLSRCAFVVAGRPYAVLRELDRQQKKEDSLWDRVNDIDWRFVRLEEFNQQQQIAFLGKLSDGKTDRWTEIHSDARPILKVPRVLEYLREVDEALLASIRTPSDVMFLAVNHLLHRGIETDQGRRLLQTGDQPAPIELRPAQHELAFDFLSAVAFQMVADFAAQSDAPPESFERVAENLDEFRDRVQHRLEYQAHLDANTRAPGQWKTFYKHNPTLFTLDFARLIGMNATSQLKHALFESDQPLQFSNRGLQEFLAAAWLARHCSDNEVAEFWNMVYQAGIEKSEAYYQINRYLAEMPKKFDTVLLPARNDTAWARAAGVWYRPGDGTIEGTKRSTEMLFRSWGTMHELAGEPVIDWWDCSFENLIANEAKLRSGEGPPTTKPMVATARETLDAFFGEFQSILDGTHGPEIGDTEQLAARRHEWQRHALALTKSFIHVDGGTFEMGAPKDKQGMGPELRAWYQAVFAQDGEPEEIIARNFNLDGWPRNKPGQQRLRNFLEFMAGCIRDNDLDRYENRSYRADETPAEVAQTVGDFGCAEVPLLNAWWRVFDPGHGLSPSWFADEQARISPHDDCPAIYLSWYDVWALAQWLRWRQANGMTMCRLPHEPEFEFLAKHAQHPEWNYWWGDSFDESDADMCNGNRRIGQTRSPWKGTPSYRAALPEGQRGFRDLLGNVLEWMANRYRESYSRYKHKNRSGRSMRGGSWLNYPTFCRAAFRFRFLPVVRLNYTGVRLVVFRLARTS